MRINLTLKELNLLIGAIEMYLIDAQSGELPTHWLVTDTYKELQTKLGDALNGE